MTNDENPAIQMDQDLLLLSASIVTAYVSHNSVKADTLPHLILEVHGAIKGLVYLNNADPAPEQKPAVPIRKSVTHDYIVCLEDGKKFKSLKRHLRSHYDLSPEEYREKWSLPSDYPMVAPSYSASRSQMAKQSGLGRKG